MPPVILKSNLYFLFFKNHQKMLDGKEKQNLEKEMYRSCLKQVVAYLNTTLPPLSESEESIIEPKTPKVDKIKKIKKEIKPVENSYLIRDTIPSKVLSKEPIKDKSKDKLTRKTRSIMQKFKLKHKKSTKKQ